MEQCKEDICRSWCNSKKAHTMHNALHCSRDVKESLHVCTRYNLVTDRYLQTGPSQLRRSQPITLSPLEMFVGGYQQSKIGKLRTWTLPENPNNWLLCFFTFCDYGTRCSQGLWWRQFYCHRDICKDNSTVASTSPSTKSICVTGQFTTV